jgi:methionyl-tRNA formyltransferase
MTRGRVVVCAVGLKGAVFLERLADRGVIPSLVVTYSQPDDRHRSFERITDAAQRLGCGFEVSRRPKLGHDDLIFLVGWQFRITDAGPSTVVFHDSLLPRYRGFAPTVAALINGDAEIGVTALRPSPKIDEGPVLAQRSVPVRHPTAVAEALELQAGLMVELAQQLHEDWRTGSLHAVPQDESKATYSLWRDDLDYVIDWSRSAAEILRFVAAVGYPYAGARTYLGATPITVVSASLVDDLRFEHRQPGKVWTIEEGRPQVVCGEGLLRLDDCRLANGESFMFVKLRSRLTMMSR